MHLKLVDYLSKNLNDKIINYSSIHGGCINECFKLESKNRDYFVKINSSFNFFKPLSVIGSLSILFPFCKRG